MYYKFLFVTFIFSTLTTTIHSLELNHVMVLGRIIGGHATTIQDIPYQCSLWNGTIHFCGGAILSNEWIITAAHCMGKMGEYKVRINSTIANSGGTLIEVVADYSHPYFNEVYSYDYDVALIRVKKMFLSGLRYIRWPQCGSTKCISEVGNMIEISGWGVNNITDPVKRLVLQKARVPIVDRNYCAKIYEDATEVTERMFCAGDIEKGGRDTCEGDSGGPATCKGDLVGVVSAGTVQCALSDRPGMYTDLMNDKIQEWIEKTTGISRNCPKADPFAIQHEESIEQQQQSIHQQIIPPQIDLTVTELAERE